MVTIILPGYSSHNKKWLEETAQQIKSDGEIRPIYWGHWDDPTKKFDAKEKAHLLDGVTGRRVVDIIAKSIGTLVTSFVVETGPEKVRKIILCGIPINGLSETDKEKIKSALKLVPPENIICFQNDEDPYGDLGQVKKLLSDIDPKILLIEKIRSDHEYFYQDEFNKFLLG